MREKAYESSAVKKQSKSVTRPELFAIDSMMFIYLFICLFIVSFRAEFNPHEFRCDVHSHV